MLNFNEIKDLFGAPLDEISKQGSSKSIRLWQIAAVSLIVYLSCEGVKALYNNQNEKYKKKI